MVLVRFYSLPVFYTFDRTHSLDDLEFFLSGMIITHVIVIYVVGFLAGFLTRIVMVTGALGLQSTVSPDPYDGRKRLGRLQYFYLIF